MKLQFTLCKNIPRLYSFDMHIFFAALGDFRKSPKVAKKICMSKLVCGVATALQGYRTKPSDFFSDMCDCRQVYADVKKAYSHGHMYPVWMIFVLIGFV